MPLSIDELNKIAGTLSAKTAEVAPVSVTKTADPQTPAPARQRPVGNPSEAFDWSGGVAPWVTSGEVGQDSRGYSVMRAMKAMMGMQVDQAKNELMVHQAMLSAGYRQEENGIIVPLSSRQMTPNRALQGLGLKKMMAEAVSGVDPDEVAYLYNAAGIQDLVLEKARQLKKDLSSIDGPTGGFLIDPGHPTEIMDILRDRSILGRSRIVQQDLPPSGRLPKLKTKTDVTWTHVGEGTNIRTGAASTPALEQRSLLAKLAAGFAILPMQLVQFSSPSAEAWVRQLFGDSLGEFVNQTIYFGTGTNGAPRGVLNTPGVGVRLATTTGANGDTLGPLDPRNLVTDVLSADGTFDEWHVHPVTTGRIWNMRADAAAAADAAGNFLFVPPIDGRPARLQGYPVVESSKMPLTRAKGSASNLTAMFGGQTSSITYGSIPAIEIRSSTEAGTSFENNQMWIRALAYHDVLVMYPEAIYVIDTLIQ